MTDSDDAPTTVAIIALSRSLRLKVLAEGVETAEQPASLRHHGCDETQGSLYARQMPEAALVAWLRKAQHVALLYA